LLQQLGTDDVRQAVAAADVVVLTVGANDVESAADPASCSLAGPDADAAARACYQDELAALTPNLDRITAQVAALPTSPGARVLVTGYWNVFLDGSAARTRGDTYVRVADAVTKVVNQRIAAAAAAHGAEYVDLFAPFRGKDGSWDATPLLAGDGDHPNADGHRAIEKALASAL
jgi:lysophospholipase L1-like esterase